MVSHRAYKLVQFAGFALLLSLASLAGGCSSFGVTNTPTAPALAPWFQKSSYVGPPLPRLDDIQRIEPNFPPGRRAWVNKIAASGHQQDVEFALFDPHGQLAAFPAVKKTGGWNAGREGELVLQSGVRLAYLIRRGSPSWLYLQIANGSSVKLEILEESDADDV